MQSGCKELEWRGLKRNRRQGAGKGRELDYKELEWRGIEEAARSWKGGVIEEKTNAIRQQGAAKGCN